MFELSVVGESRKPRLQLRQEPLPRPWRGRWWMGQVPSLPVALVMVDAVQESKRLCNNDVTRRRLEPR